MDCSTPGFPVFHCLPEFAQTHVHWVSDAIQPSHPLSRPLLLLPSIFPSIMVFSNELALRIRWPKYWSFSFSVSTSSEYSRLISFRIDWFDFFAVLGTVMSLLQHHRSKASIFAAQPSLWSNSHIHLLKNRNFDYMDLCPQSDVSPSPFQPVGTPHPPPTHTHTHIHQPPGVSGGLPCQSQFLWRRSGWALQRPRTEGGMGWP